MQQHLKPQNPLVNFTGQFSSFLVALLLVNLISAGLNQPGLPAVFGSNTQPLLVKLANEIPDQPISIIVQKNQTSTSPEQALKELGGTVTAELSFINSFAAILPASQVPNLAAQPGVKFISLDAPVVKTGSASLCTNCVDPNAAINFTRDIKANQVWNNNTNSAAWLQGQGIGIAVLDSGVDPKLKDFTSSTSSKSRVLTQAKINRESPSVNDVNGHGTLVAGVVASNGTGSGGLYPGVAPGSNIVSVKVSNDNGNSTTLDVLMGIEWVYLNRVAYNIRVVNISFNSSVSQSYNFDPLDVAVEALWFSGITVVVSAGNNGAANLFAPANDPFVITVGAAQNKGTNTAPNWVVSSFSAYGKDEIGGLKPDLVAPGVGIISGIANPSVRLATEHIDRVFQVPGSSSTTGHSGVNHSPVTGQSGSNTYMRVSGTSFAAPQVAGAAALLLQSEPQLTPDQIKYRLKATANQSSPRGSWDTRPTWSGFNSTTAGAGFLDVQAAVTQTHITGKSNVGVKPSNILLVTLVQSQQLQLNWPGGTSNNVNWSSVNWSSVNWSSVNWSSVNWSSVNWSSINRNSIWWDQ